jgi:hypothetical protein
MTREQLAAEARLEWERVKAQAAIDEQIRRSEIAQRLRKRPDHDEREEARTVDLIIAARRGQRAKDASR